MIGTFVDEREYKAQLVQLQKVLPHWLQIITLVGKMVVKQ
jgi:hypothetical protein